jgi:FGGY-family pentulose kinase
MNQHNIDPETVRGIGFDATCSLTVFNEETGEPQSVTGPKFDNADGNDRNVILWLDHRPVEETKKVNGTKHNLLRYVGGTMSIEMEMPKILWLKNNMPPELFAKCSFYDLGDALTKMATGQDARSFCSTVCKQGYVPVGVDGSEKGWQEDFLKEIGLEDLTKDNCRRLGGINGLVSLTILKKLTETWLTTIHRTTSSTLPARRLPHFHKRLPTISASLPTLL